MLLFYSPSVNSEIHSLNQEESKHCLRVLRLKKGDIIHLTDGRGNLYKTELIDDDSKICNVRIIQTTQNYSKDNYHLNIAIAPTKNNTRFEWFLEKATEIGIHQITPMICDNSERKIINHDRLNKILVSAMKQSLKSYLPELSNIQTFNSVIQTISKNTESNNSKFIAVCNYPDALNLNIFFNSKSKIQNPTFLIGPEGDFSKREIETAINSGYTPITLMNSRLRTETAALLCCSYIKFINS